MLLCFLDNYSVAIYNMARLGLSNKHLQIIFVSFTYNFGMEWAVIIS